MWNANSPRLIKEDGVPEEEWLETYWGYIVSMGSTEGNLLALRNARDYLNGTELQYDQEGAEAFLAQGGRNFRKAAAILLKYVKYQQPVTSSDSNEFTPVLFFSESTHYAVTKIAQILNLKTFGEIGNSQYPGQCPTTSDGVWPSAVPTNEDDTVDLDQLVPLAEFFIREKYPIAINFNYGTTWTTAYDDVGVACERLIPILQDAGMYEREVSYSDGTGTEQTRIRNGFWFHVDGALGAGIAPFLKDTEEIQKYLKEGETPPELPEFDFNCTDGQCQRDIHSIAMSGHKWPGAPWPCGIYMTKNKFLITNNTPSYVGSLDSTLAGSRNAFSALIMWSYLAKRSHSEQVSDAYNAWSLASYAYDELVKLYGQEFVTRAPNGLAVIFPRPSMELVKKYALSSESDQSHIMMMRHVTQERIDALITDLKAQPSLEAQKPAGVNKMQEILQQGW
ncbi:MAG: histidine decarboxylase [Symploca sp. SIO3E6]|nr:histidine decarboxylase [Caldora sp. SIO3E6]